MPTVPRVTRQVGLNPLPGARKTASETFESLGGQAALARGRVAAVKAEGRARVADALAGVAERVSSVAGSVYGDILRRENEASDQATQLQAQHRMDMWWIKRTQGDGQTKGAFDAQGENALGLPEQLAQEENELADEIEKGMTPGQREQFQAYRLRARAQHELDARRFTDAAVTKVREQALVAAANTKAQGAVSHYRDAGLFMRDLADLKQTIAGAGKAYGWKQEAIDQETLKYTTDAYLGAIGGLLAEHNTEGAKALFAAATGQAPGQLEPGNISLAETGVDRKSGAIGIEVDGQLVLIPTVSEDGRKLTDAQAREEYQRTRQHYGVFVDDQAIAAYAQSLTTGGAAARGEQKYDLDPKQWSRIQDALQAGTVRDTAMRESDRITALPGTMKDWLAEAAKIKNGEVREAVEARIRAHQVDRDKQERDEIEAIGIKAGNILDGMGPRASVEAIPLLEWQRLTPAAKGGLEQYAAYKRRGEPVETDFATWYDLLQRATSIDPQVRAKFLEENLTAYKGRLAEGDLKMFAKAQADGRGGSAYDPKLFASDKQQSDMVDEALSGMFGADWSTAAKNDPALNERILSFRRKVRESVLATQGLQPTQKLNDEQVRGIIDLLISPVGNAEGWFTSSPVFAFERKQAQFTRLEDVPYNVRKAYESAMWSKGVDPTTPGGRKTLLANINYALAVTRGDITRPQPKKEQ